MDLSRLSQKELAKLLLVEDRTLRNLKDEGIPQHGEGRGLYYVWAEVLPWWIERQARLAATRKGPAGIDIPSIFISEARKAAADAEIAEMRAEVMKGNLLEAEAVKEVWSRHIARAASKLESVGAKAAVLVLDGQTVAERQRVIDREVFAVMADLQQGGLDG